MRKRIPFLTLLLLLALCFSAVTAVSAAPAGGPPKPPTRTIPVTGNGVVDVASGAINQFVMKDGDLVVFPQMSTKGLKASFATETKKTLPTSLPEGFSFVDGYSISVISSGKAIDSLPGKGKILVSFEQNAEWLHCDGDAVIAILHWSEKSGWQEVAANSLEASFSEPGIFVLAKR